jgi:hypothetical protein
MTLKEKLQLAESRLPFQSLARQLGLVVPDRPGEKCSSPLRQDDNPSWSYSYANDGRIRWRDWSTGDFGDCADFVARALGLSKKDGIKKYLELAGVPDKCPDFLPILKPVAVKPIIPKKEEPREKPKLPEDIHPGTDEEIAELLLLRDWDNGEEALKEASSLGFLRFGTWRGERSWFLVDPAGRFFEARRMDGQKWFHGGKSDSKGSKSLLGAEHLKAGSLALLVEGAPDFLACSIYKSAGRQEGACFPDDAVPVSLFGSSMRLSPEDLARFKGVRVIIFPHLDSQGRKARDTWKAQLRKAGARVGDICLQRFVQSGGKDLADTLFPYFNRDLVWAIESRAEQLRD